jgi:hypothetical protein
MFVVLFYKDGSHELIESKNGISFLTKSLRKEKVTRVYFAKSNADAKAAIEVLTPQMV